MKQKGLCRALLLILFATCAVAGRVQEVGHVGGRYGTMDFSPLSSSIVPGRYRGLFPGKLLWWILGLMGTA